MGNSFQDQFLKAGLINKQQATKNQKQQGKKRKQQRHQVVQSKAVDHSKKERDRELNRQQVELQRKKAMQSEVSQLISQHQLKDVDGDKVFHFTHDKTIKTLHLQANIHAQLVKGQLVIAISGAGYGLLPVSVADKIRERDATYLIDMMLSKTDTTEDDPYAAFQVPDDLMW